MSIQACSHIAKHYPGLRPVLKNIGVLPKLRKKKILVAEAVVRVTIGQMLSGIAARTIYQRVLDSTKMRNLRGGWLLESTALRACGLSARKIRTIKQFGASYESRPEVYEAWKTLPFEELLQEVRGFWGLSDWSASILSIFYFGNENVFPMEDGSLLRAIRLIDVTQKSRKAFDPTLASPYKSYLARYLWKALDDELLTASSNAPDLRPRIRLRNSTQLSQTKKMPNSRSS